MDRAGYFDTDCTVYDLEDSVTPANKDTARLMVVNALHQPEPNARERGVRINSVGSGLALVDLRRVLGVRTSPRSWRPKLTAQATCRSSGMSFNMSDPRSSRSPSR